MKASIFSIYMPNVSKEVAQAQAACVRSVLPEGWRFEQMYQTVGTHPSGLKMCLDECKDDIIVFLDIDCIPLSRQALEFMAQNANNGMLTGAVQRANHINNGNHLYVGPFCMAFSKPLYKAFGSPSFCETARGDVGEELTYRWQARQQALCFLWPSAVVEPQWELDYGFKFGFGTTYGTSLIHPYMFYHTFNARNSEMQKVFISKCQEVLNQRSNA